MADAQTATDETTFSSRHCCGGRAKRKWSAAEIAAMVGGFVIFWPLGLLALGAKLVKGEMWPGASDNTAPWSTWRKPADSSSFSRGWQQGWHTGRSSGNEAFDDYRKAQLERLEAERRKLEDEQRAFGEYLARLRKAKDQDEFDRFMAERNIVTPKSE